MTELKKSTRPDKKYMVRTPKGKLIHFGDAKMEHYEDKALGIWSHLDHGDIMRRMNYRKRAKGIRNKDGKQTYKDPEYANFYSYHLLW